MEKKHTPGPWKMKPSESKTAYNVVGTHLGGLYKIARCPWLKTEDTKFDERSASEALANANLIAASPKLLEAVELLWSKVDLSRFTYEEIVFIHEVVAAATK